MVFNKKEGQNGVIIDRLADSLFTVEIQERAISRNFLKLLCALLAEKLVSLAFVVKR